MSLRGLCVRMGRLLALACLLGAAWPAVLARAEAARLPTAEAVFPLSPYLQQVMVQEAPGQDHAALAQAIASGAWYRRDAQLASDFTFENQWFVFSFENPSEDAARLYVELAAPDIQDLEWFAFESGQLQAYYHLGAQQPFSARPVPYSRLLLPLAIAPGKTVDVVLRTQGHSRLLVEKTQVWQQEARIARMLPEISAMWFFVGVMSVMIFYHLFIALITRERSYWYYIGWLLASLLMILAFQGYGFWLLWPEWVWWEVRATLALSLLMMVMFGLFSREFLSLPVRQPIINRVVEITAGVLLLQMLLFLWYSEAVLFWVVRLGVGAMFCMVATIWLSSFRQGVAKRTEARHFFFAWTPFMLYSVYEIGSRMWTQRWYDPVGPMMQWSFALTVTLLAIALADRMRELRDRSQKARVESRAKSEFLAKMSHEIRTPLNGMLGMAALLRETRLDKTQRHYSDVIFSSGTALLTVINDILDYSKIEAGKMQLESIDFDLEKLALETAAIFKVQADEKGVDLIFDMDPSCPRWVKGDPNRLRQIIINMLGNAIKFTEKGEVVVRLVRDAMDPGLVRLEVRDTGIGIAAEHCAHLFDFFTQVDSSTSRRYGGTGLGLAICKELATLMGGTVGVESRIHEGSTFWATLRLPEVAGRPGLHPARGGLQRKRLLVVDDCATFASLVRRYAQDWGAEVVVAANAAQAEQAVADAVAAARPFDLISIDLHMPQVDGLELADTLNRDARFASIPKLLLTSAIDLPGRADLRSHGLVLAIEKPISPWALEDAYVRALTDDGSDPQQLLARGKELQAASRPMNILVAEDNEVNQLVVRGMLERMGHEVTVVKNGALVVEAFIACMRPGAHWKPFDLILMDCEMPEMDGYEATMRIREWEKAAPDIPPIPIVALTAHVLPEYLQRCLDSGMNDYLLKPVGLEALQSKIEAHVSRKGLH